MEERPLRPGDPVVDYCPRERRVTDHAVVAIVEGTIRQTRCVACDAEHPYKGGTAPRRRKKPSTEALYEEVLAGAAVPSPAREAQAAVAASHPASPPIAESAVAVLDADVEADTDTSTDGDGDEPAFTVIEDDGAWPGHRPLIRASLPRPEGHVPSQRQAPELTMRQPGVKGAQAFDPDADANTWADQRQPQGNSNKRGGFKQRPGKQAQGNGGNAAGAGGGGGRSGRRRRSGKPRQPR